MNGDGLAIEWARGLCRVVGMRKASNAGGVERLARVDRRLAVTSEIWDQDKLLLGTPGGTVDLRDGSIRQGDQGDYITKQVAVAPAPPGSAPPRRWLQFLAEAMRDDLEMVRFLQVAAGYCLTGQTKEHALFFSHGVGGNGKTVFTNTLRRIMGDYAAVAQMDTFMASANTQHPTDVASLRGARLVCASETEEGRAWAESRIKSLTGGDPIKARFMRQDGFEFTPELKLWIVGNHKPVLKQVDDAIRRRFKLIPWLYIPPNPNRMLEQELMEEWPQILRWAIDGCLIWQKEGLKQPQAIAKETNAYFSDQDSLAQWMSECCEIEPESTHESVAGRALASKLYGSWKKWCDANGEDAGSGKALSMNLQKRGFTKKPTMYGKEYLRIRLRRNSAETQTGPA
jgi:putative DNA primase/helicase